LARLGVAWALNVDPSTLPLDAGQVEAPKPTARELFQYPRSVAVSWATNFGFQTGYYGLTLWSPVLLVQFLKIPPAQAAFYMIFVTLAAFAGRIGMSILSEKVGRRGSGVICSFGAVLILLIAAWRGDLLLGATIALLGLLMAAFFFGEGGFAILGPYSAEVWPTHLRATGMGSAYGFGGIGKILGPLGLAVVVGASTTAAPSASGISVQAAFLYFSVWYAISGLAYLLLGFETRGQSLEAIGEKLKARHRASH
jgi:putative MFS transporter